MAQWETFIGFLGVILVLLLALARASTVALSNGDSTAEPTEPVDQPATGTAGESAVDSGPEPTGSPVAEPDHESVEEALTTPTDERRSTASESPPAAVANDRTADSETPHQRVDIAEASQMPTLSTPALLANVAVSQGLFAVLLVTMAWYSEIPAAAFGLAADHLSLETIGLGIGVGVVFYIGNEAAAVVGRRYGFATPTALREALAPETAAGWAVLLGVVLPIIAGFEELLFRGALIGVVHEGFGVSAWLLAIGSSIAFALGHGAQGKLGIVVTGIVGVGLAAVFILSGSLVVVIVAHYVINTLEFLVHEGVAVDSLSRAYHDRR